MFRTVPHNRWEQIQIRVTPREKAALRRLARAAGRASPPMSLRAFCLPHPATVPRS